MKKRVIISIVGNRPQFIKLAPLSAVCRKYFHELILHTGQHYDRNMSDNFFNELSIPTPDINLRVGSGTHAQQTMRMLVGIEKTLLRVRPWLVLVYGDTNSTLAGALAAAKLHIPVAHIEAGLRSGNMSMPEEINRITTDHLASYLFCPTANSARTLHKESPYGKIFTVGDLMYDSLRRALHVLDKRKKTTTYTVSATPYALLTCHRESTTNNRAILKGVIRGILQAKERVIFPLHPRTKKYLQQYGLYHHLRASPYITTLPPQKYLDMLDLQRNARVIITDSGGVQKEAYLLRVPCITIRKETEWVETVDSGWNILVGTNQRLITEHLQKIPERPRIRTDFYGDGHAAEKIVSILRKI